MALCMAVNKAKLLYNEALSRADRGMTDEAVRDLKAAVEIDATFSRAWLVLGTLEARRERMDDAIAAWEAALATDPTLARAHEYIEKAKRIRPAIPKIRGLRRLCLGLATALVALLFADLVRLSLSEPGVRLATWLLGPEDARARLGVFIVGAIPFAILVAQYAGGDARRTLERWAALFRD